MAATKAGAAIDIVQEVAAATLLVGNDEAIGTTYNQGVLLHLACSADTAHTGTEIIVQINNLTTGNDENWVDLCRFIALVGTAANEVLSVGEPAGETVIVVADTTGFITEGVCLFLEDITAFADSEWILQADHIVNTSITAADGLANAHLVNSILYNLAETHYISIPSPLVQVRVLYNNTGNSTIAIRSDIAELTGV